MTHFKRGDPKRELSSEFHPKLAERLTAGGHAQDRPTPTSADLVGLAERLSTARERRPRFLANELFAEPGWDMILALFRTDNAGHRMTVSNLCLESHVPVSTALRWVEKLVELGLARRVKNPLDGRVIFIELEAEGRSCIHDCLSHIWTVFYGND